MNLPDGEKSQSGFCQIALEADLRVTQVRQMAMPELRRRRKALGLSLEKLAAMVGLSISQVQRFETGQREPRASDLESLSAALGCTIQELRASAPKKKAESASPSPFGSLLPVPIIGRTAAGVFREVVEFDDLGPEYVFEPEDEDFPKARRFALDVDGQSMNAASPPIPDGSRVVCIDFEATGLPFIEGMIVAIERTREGGHLREWSVKEIELHDDEVWFCPRSTDAKYKPIKIKNDPSSDEWNSFRVIGLVRDVSQKVRPSRRFR